MTASADRSGASPSANAGGEHRLIVAGSGGQGILTLGKLLCMAAMSDGKKATYLPAYGPEVRGGTANCQVVISPDVIYSPLVELADSLIIFNQLSYERFGGALRDGGLMLVNSSGVDLGTEGERRCAALLALPATELAAEMGDVRVANIIMLGAFVTIRKLVAEQSCLAALSDLLGRRKAALLQLNERAFARGTELARRRPSG